MAAANLPQKIVAAFFSVLIFGQVCLADASQASLWSERHAATGAIATLPLSVPPIATVPLPYYPPAKPSPAPLTSLIAALRPELGAVRDIQLPNGKITGAVVNIQDIHRNAEAQENIRRVTLALADAGVGTAALEGAEGPLRLEPLQTTIPASDRGAVSRFLLKENRISGPAAAAITSDAPLKLFGIDDTGLHAANVEAYRQSRALKEAFSTRLQTARADLLERKTRDFSPALAQFDSIVARHRAGALSLGAYVTALAGYAEKQTPAISHFLEAFAIESKLDFAAVERDRRTVLEQLAIHASKGDLNRILALTVSLRTGRASSADFYGGLADICKGARVPLSRFPSLQSYVRYVLLSDQIRPDRLLADVASLEKRTYEALTLTSAEREIVADDRWVCLAAKLSDFALSNSEWIEYASAPRPAFAPAAPTLQPFESFYALAGLRDEAIARRTVSALTSTPNARLTLVTGGFHAAGVERRLLAAGIAVVSFTPRLTRAADGSTYLSVFARERTPLEKLFAGERLFLAGHPFPDDVRTGEFPAAALGRAVLQGRTPASPTNFIQTSAPDADITGASVRHDGDAALVQIERNGDSVDIRVRLSVDGEVAALDERATLTGTFRRPAFERLVKRHWANLGEKRTALERLTTAIRARLTVGAVADFSEIPPHPHHTHLLVLPLTQWLLAFAHRLIHPFSEYLARETALPGAERGRTLSAHRAAWRADSRGAAIRLVNRLWFRSLAVPGIELPGLPGLAFLAYPLIGILSPALAPWLAPVIAGLTFALMHGIPGRGQSWAAFFARFAASTFINGAAIGIFVGVSGLGGIALAVFSAYALHGAWNAVAPRDWALTLPDWNSRIEELFDRIEDEESRQNALGDLDQLMRGQLNPSYRNVLIRRLIRTLHDPASKARDAMPIFLLQYTHYYPRAGNEHKRIYSALFGVAGNAAEDTGIRRFSIGAAVELALESSALRDRRDDLARELLGILGQLPPVDVAEAAFMGLERLARQIRSTSIRREIALEIIHWIDVVDGTSVAERARPLASLYETFRSVADRRALLTAVIRRLPTWENTFERTPEAMGELGVMLAGWISDPRFSHDILPHELDQVSDHVVRFYPRVGAMYDGLARNLVERGLLGRAEAERLRYAHWDLHPSHLEREPIGFSDFEAKYFVLGRLQMRSPGLSVVQTPEWELKFLQNPNDSVPVYADTLPAGYEADAHIVQQEGHGVLYYPARLVSGENAIDFLALLGEPAKFGTDILFDEPATHRPSVLRAWISWKIGPHSFRRPALPIGGYVARFRSAPMRDPEVVPLGHSQDLSLVYYLFSETGVIYTKTIDREALLRNHRELASFRDTFGGTIGVVAMQDEMMARARILRRLGEEIHRFNASEVGLTLIDLTQDALTKILADLGRKSDHLYAMIFGDTSPGDIVPELANQLIGRFLESRHALDADLVRDLIATIGQHTNGFYLPSLNVIFSEDGMDWLIRRTVELAGDNVNHPLPPDVSAAMAQMKQRLPRNRLWPARDPRLKVLAWLGVPAAMASHKLDQFERLLMTPGQQLQTILATFVLVRLRGVHHEGSFLEFVTDHSNDDISHELGDILRLAEPLFTPRLKEINPRPTFVEITVKRAIGRRVFPAAAGKDGTVGEALDSITARSGVNRQRVARVVALRPGAPPAERQMTDKVQSGDSLLIELKNPEDAGPMLVPLSVFGNIGLGTLIGAVVAAVLVAMGQISPFDAIRLMGIITTVTIIAHEAWHYLTATIVWVYENALRGDRTATIPPVFMVALNRAIIGVSAMVSTPVLGVVVAAAGFSAIPLVMGVSFLGLSFAASTIAITTIVAINVLSLVPTNSIANRWPRLGLPRWMSAPTDGDQIFRFLSPGSVRTVVAMNSEKAAASITLDAMQILRDERPDPVAFAARLEGLAADASINLDISSAEGRLTLVTGGSLLDPERLARELKAQAADRGLRFTPSQARRALQEFIFDGAASADIASALAETALHDNTADIAILPANMPTVSEDRLLKLLSERQSIRGGLGRSIVLASPPRAKRLNDLGLPGIRVIAADRLLGTEDHRPTVDLARAEQLLEENAVDLNSFSNVNLIAPAGHTVLAGGLSPNLPWVRRTVILIIDDLLQTVTTTLPTINRLERMARAVASQA